MKRWLRQVNASWQPNITETLSGDEIYSNGSPNLLVVGNDSLYIYALTRQPTCDGETWGYILLDQPDCPQFSSDGGLGLAAGAQAAGLSVHQLDWDHLLRPLWGQAARLESQAYAALEAVEQRAGKFSQAHTAKRLEQHFQVWEKLGAEVVEKIAQHDRFFQLARQVDEQFALIDLQSGQVRDPVLGTARLQALGEQALLLTLRQRQPGECPSGAWISPTPTHLLSNGLWSGRRARSQPLKMGWIRLATA